MQKVKCCLINVSIQGKYSGYSRKHDTPDCQHPRMENRQFTILPETTVIGERSDDCYEHRKGVMSKKLSSC